MNPIIKIGLMLIVALLLFNSINSGADKDTESQSRYSVFAAAAIIIWVSMGSGTFKSEPGFWKGVKSAVAITLICLVIIRVTDLICLSLAGYVAEHSWTGIWTAFIDDLGNMLAGVRALLGLLKGSESLSNLAQHIEWVIIAGAILWVILHSLGNHLLAAFVPESISVGTKKIGPWVCFASMVIGVGLIAYSNDWLSTVISWF